MSAQPPASSEPEDDKWRLIKGTKRVKTPTLLQMEAVECGAASLGIVLRHFGVWLPLEELRIKCGVSRDGSKASNILKAARGYGLDAKGFKHNLATLKTMPMPAIIHWNFNHFLVLEGFDGKKVFLNNPSGGPQTVSEDDLEGSYTGVVMTFSPGPDFKKSGSKPSMLTALLPRLKGLENGLLFAVLTGLFLVIPGLAIPAFSRIFVDDILVAGRADWLVPMMWGMGITAAIMMLLTWLQQYYLLRFETKLALSSSAKFFRHVLRLPVEFFSQRFGGEIGSRVLINDKVARTLSEQFVTLLIELVTVVAFGALMFMYDWVLAVVAIILAAVNVVTLQTISRKRVDASRRLLQETGKLMGTSMGGLQMMETLKATGSEGEFFGRWSGYQAKTLAAKQELGVFAQITGVVPPTITALTTAFILVVGGLRIMDGHITMGMLVAFQSVLMSFTRPITNFVTFAGKLQELEGDMNRLDDVLRYEVDKQYLRTYDPNRIDPQITKLSGHLEIKNLNFGYSPLEPPLIDNLSLIIKPGQRVALVGGSGSGKSTVAKIVAGLYPPWTGQVLFDGIPREEIPPDLLNTSVAVVDQEVFMFAGTVRENLTMWDATTPDQDVMDALRDAAILDIVAARPGGDQSWVEEAGANFSGGQRQRLEIARALVGRPTFLILDEATSALDPTTEMQIDAAMRRRGCACLIVAHRLSTIRDCDEIIVMRKGKVVQRGTHEEMLAVPGPYQELMHE